MFHCRSTMQCVGIAAVLAGCLALPGVSLAKNGPPSSNPGNPFAEILEALRGVTQNWDKKLDSTNGEADGCNSDRFTCIWPTAEHPNGAVVRDNETGIVWDRHPDSFGTWSGAIGQCANREVGGRKGWSLPMREQLATLVDTTSDSCLNDNICLPDGHPFFSSVEEGIFWSSSTSVYGPSSAWILLINGDTVFGNSGDVMTRGKDEGFLFGAWCARGGQVYDGQDLNSLP